MPTMPVLVYLIAVNVSSITVVKILIAPLVIPKIPKVVISFRTVAAIVRKREVQVG